MHISAGERSAVDVSGASAMRVQVLHVADCPNALARLDRLAQVFAGRADVHVDTRLVKDGEEAARLGMTGSPTLLVDGVDPFGRADQPASLSCRLYIDDAGTFTGVPTLAQLRAAITDDPAVDSR